MLVVDLPKLAHLSYKHLRLVIGQFIGKKVKILYFCGKIG